jgi:ABC-type bacteriocin/lantibiotic exporter with double-glycine peptidase domain
MELLIFSAVLGSVLWFLMSKGSLDKIIPLITLYGFTIYRLMPTFQSIFTSAARMKFNMPTLDYIYKDLVLSNTEKLYPTDTNLELKNRIKLENISYTYSSKDRPAISDINLEIKVGTVVGVAGVTGSGKTTLIDIILGLLIPTSGKIYIDNRALTTDDTKSWQNIVGYVPQNICLLDDSIKRNIALGIKDNEINDNLLQKAVSIADLQEFIESQLLDKYIPVLG